METLREKLTDILEADFPPKLAGNYANQILLLLCKELEAINTKEHICRFNDGEQNCECYLECLEKINNLFK